MKKFHLGDTAILLLIAAASVTIHTLVNNGYGFHRDELAMLDDAKNLAWGYVSYPPFTPFIVRLALELFGPNLAGLRFFSALAMSGVMVLSGLVVRELGGSRWAQVIAALAVGIAPVALALSAFAMYETYDYFWWVVVTYLLVRLLKSGNPRWWLAIGAAIGLGLMTKYNMAFLAAGIALGVIVTPARRFLKSPWLWGGAALAVLIFSPNLVWQVQHNFVTLQFTATIHSRDVGQGRTASFLLDQLYVCLNPASIYLFVMGMIFYWRDPDGRPYRLLGWAFVVPFLLYLILQGRDYYQAPAYPVVIAAGAYLVERRARSALNPARRGRWAALYGGLAVGAVLGLAFTLPIAPINSGWWKAQIAVDNNLLDEIGWPDLVQATARVRDALPQADLPRLGILAGNYGEAGAIDLYGPAYGLPRAISGINSYWLRGYGDPPPQTVIVVGFNGGSLSQYFASCSYAGRIDNSYGVANEESIYHPDIFVCRDLRAPLPELWKTFQYFG